MNRLRSQIRYALLGSMRASPDAHDHLEKYAPDTGDVDAMAATGAATQGERPLTEVELGRLRKLVSVPMLLWRWISGMLAGVVVAFIGMYAFGFVEALGMDSFLGDIANTIAWVFMGGGFILFVGTFFSLIPMLLSRGKFARDFAGRRVLALTGKLAKHSRPPQMYWVVGDRSFTIVDDDLWDEFNPGETITVEWLPESLNIVRAYSAKHSVDFLRGRGV